MPLFSVIHKNIKCVECISFIITLPLSFISCIVNISVCQLAYFFFITFVGALLYSCRAILPTLQYKIAWNRGQECVLHLLCFPMSECASALHSTNKSGYPLIEKLIHNTKRSKTPQSTLKLSPIQTWLALQWKVGNKIFTVLLSNLINHTEQHF